MILLLLAGCGAGQPLDQPNPPPTPPPQYASAGEDTATLSGVVSEVHPPTRSWVLLGEGKRQICHLHPGGVIELGGVSSQVADLVNGSTVAVEGVAEGDLMIVKRVVGASPPEAAPAPETAPLPAAAPPSP